ncbi:MAG: glutathione-disulfide reductase [Litorivicinus sp.]
MKHYDLFVIGAGSGGVRAARMAAATGAKVAVAEDRYMGGTCVNVGCVPKKLYVYASEYRHQIQDAAGFGWQVQAPTHDWSALVEAKKQEIARLNGIYNRMLDGAEVTVYNARASILSANQVQVGDEVISADKILVATGGWPFMPEIPGIEHTVSSNEIFDLEVFPQRILIVGGGYVAVEFAGIFNGLGARTTLSYRGDRFLKNFDEEIVEALAHEMTQSGIEIALNDYPTAFEKQTDGSIRVDFKHASSAEYDAVLMATGRVPNVNGLGLDALGVEMGRNNAIKVNSGYQTNVPSIFALGDVVEDSWQLTPVATSEAMVFVRRWFGSESDAQMDYRDIPTAIFSQPNIGTVGLIEREAREQGIEIDVYVSNFKAMRHTLSGRDERTLMKLLVRRSDQRVIGCQMLGPDAGEIVQGLAVAIKAGATKDDFDATVGIHPTAAEEFVTMRSVTR